jgi:hypothetical protein
VGRAGLVGRTDRVRGLKKGVEPKLTPLVFTYKTYPTYETYETYPTYLTYAT